MIVNSKKLFLTEVTTMKAGQYSKGTLSDCRGGVAIIVAILLPVLIMFIALAVDIGYLTVTRNELQNVADASALSGARWLGRLYECNGDLVSCEEAMSYEDQQTYNVNRWAIWWGVQSVAWKNSAGGKDSIRILPDDIVVGRWNTDQKIISPVTNIAPTAVQVTARRDASANSPITTFFAGIMGIDTLEVSAVATASLTGLSEAAEGALPIPVAINLSWLTMADRCDEDLILYPSSGDVCAAWHVYDAEAYKNPNADLMKEMIEDYTAEEFSSPETKAGETQFKFTNGTLASLFTSDTILNLFNTMKVKNDGILDNDENSATWTTSVAVFDDATEGCSPNQSVPIVGFASIVITGVDPPPDTVIRAKIRCALIDGGRGGGLDLGTLGSIPGLVQ